MRILDMGCGWGSVSLWFAEHYPQCEIVGISNSGARGAVRTGAHPAHPVGVGDRGLLPTRSAK